jgi:hypothetical protein
LTFIKKRGGIYKAKMNSERFDGIKSILILKWQHAKTDDFRGMGCAIPERVSRLSRLLEKFINQTLSF